jgi:hypothetical protein
MIDLVLFAATICHSFLCVLDTFAATAETVGVKAKRSIAMSVRWNAMRTSTTAALREASASNKNVKTSKALNRRSPTCLTDAIVTDHE